MYGFPNQIAFSTIAHIMKSKFTVGTYKGKLRLEVLGKGLETKQQVLKGEPEWCSSLEVEPWKIQAQIPAKPGRLWASHSQPNLL